MWKLCQRDPVSPIYKFILTYYYAQKAPIKISLVTVTMFYIYFYFIIYSSLFMSGHNVKMLTLNRLSWRTFLIATISPESQSFAWYTTPKLPLPMTLVSVYATSWGRSGPAPGVATTVVTLLPSLPAGYIAPPIETNWKKPQCKKRNRNKSRKPNFF